MLKGFQSLNDLWEVCIFCCVKAPSRNYVDSNSDNDISTHRDNVSPLIFMSLPVVMIFPLMSLQLYSRRE